MRTALVLLFLLAVAAIPGSVLPQRNIASERSAQLPAPRTRRWGRYARPALGSSTCTPRPGSPRSTCCCSSRWSAAWCPGCASPLRQRCAQARRRAAAGSTGCRSTRRTTGASPRPRRSRPAAAALRGWRTVVRSRRRRVDRSRREGLPQGDRQPGLPLRAAVPALGVAFGSWYGWHGNRLLVAGRRLRLLQHPAQQYDEYGLGARVGEGDLPPLLRAAGRLPRDLPRQRPAGHRTRPT